MSASSSRAQEAPDRWVELGNRYASMGLSHAARGVYERAVRAGSAEARIMLAELALIEGEAPEAIALIKGLEAGASTPTSRLLLGRAQLAAGEISAARFAFGALIDSNAPAAVRARAHVGRAAAASREGDQLGASAHVLSALEVLLRGFAAHVGQALDDELAVVEEIMGRAVAAGRGDELAPLIAEHLGERDPGAAAAFRALALSALQASGVGHVEATEREVERLLSEALASRPESIQLRLRLAQRRSRRRGIEDEARQQTISWLGDLIAELDGAEVPRSVAIAARARAHLICATLWETMVGHHDAAVEEYLRALTFQPKSSLAAQRVVDHFVAAGELQRALGIVEASLAIDSQSPTTWRAAAHLTRQASGRDAQRTVVSRVLGAVLGGDEGAAADATEYMAAIAEGVRGEMLAGVHARGHRVKNLLGIIGARTRSARKTAVDSPVAERLRELETDVTALYDEWAVYLRSIDSADQREVAEVEDISLSALVGETVEAATARTGATIRVTHASAPIDLRGDRLLLREALQNLVSNAAEAVIQTGGIVDITVRRRKGAGGDLAEVKIVDSGPGIARGDLARIMAPGFTTKASGSGVGLTIADRVITAHHGRLLIDSEEGRGVTVVVSLPTDLGALTRRAPGGARSGGESL